MEKDSFSVIKSRAYLASTKHDLVRRIIGRKRASPTLVVRGSVRVVAAGPVESFPFQRLNSVPSISRPGVHYVRRSIIATRVVETNSASAAIHERISPSWNSVYSDQVCRRSFF